MKMRCTNILSGIPSVKTRPSLRGHGEPRLHYQHDSKPEDPPHLDAPDFASTADLIPRAQDATALSILRTYVAVLAGRPSRLLLQQRSLGDQSPTLTIRRLRTSF